MNQEAAGERAGADAKDLFRKLDQLCYPKSVAILGASEQFVKWGGLLTANLLNGGFEGPVYPINPNRATILERPAYKSLRDCPGPVDLAFITLPKDKVLAAVRECGAAGVNNLVIVTSGFSETGAEGRALEDEVVAAARAAGMRTLGPNTMGMISTRQKLFMTGAVAMPPVGGISMISQSGNLGGQVMMWAEQQGVGVNKFFGSGNEGDITCTDLLAYLGQDDTTDAILVYLEGIDDGRGFLQVARTVAAKKPIVMLKSGRTKEGAKAASSHTGALAGSREVWDGAMRQAGIMLVKNPMDLIDGAAGVENLPLPHGNRVAIVTVGGGWGVVATDLCKEYRLRLPALPAEIVALLDKQLPSYWSRANPIDLVGTVEIDLYVSAIEATVASDAFDAVITLGCIGASSIAREIGTVAHAVAPNAMNAETVAQFEAMASGIEMTLRSEIARLTKKYGKPIMNVSLDRRHNQVVIPTGDGKHIVAFNTPEKAVRVLAGMAWFDWWRQAHNGGQSARG
jgi:acyl-CoA synthetase (NDP forming)